jgi:hypothetical protein
MSKALGLVLAVAATDMRTPGARVVVEPEEDPSVDPVVDGADVELLDDWVVCETEEVALCPGPDELGLITSNRYRAPTVTSARTMTAHMVNAARRRAMTLRLRLVVECTERRR